MPMAHNEIRLEPLNKDYEAIVISNVNEGEFAVIAEFVCAI